MPTAGPTTFVQTPEPPQAGWETIAYAYSTEHPHAVAAAGTNTYEYDANGNMTCRVEEGVTYVQSYNAENRLSVVTKLLEGTCAAPVKTDTQWDFAYDGDGARVKQIVSTFDPDTQAITGIATTGYFMAGLYEETVETSTVRKYYAISGMTVAMSDADGLKYLLTDHLGSVTAVTDEEGELLSQQRYKPFGQVRTNIPQPIPNSPITQTDFGYTGQRDLPSMGLMDYNARFYDSNTGRFIQPDTLIPNPADPQSWNRYSYVRGNPIRYSDPTGHAYCPYSECDIVVNAHTEKMQLRGNLRNAAEGVVRDLGGINDLEAFTSIIEAGEGAYRSYERMMPQLSNIFIGVPNYGPGTLLAASGAGGCAGVGRDPVDCPTNASWFGDTGFHSDFRDRHNQLFHLWAYIAQTSSPGNPAGALAGLVEATGANAFHEIGQSVAHRPADGWGTSWQDYGLSVEGMILGLDISSGVMEPSELAGSISEAVSAQGQGSWGLVHAFTAVFGPMAGQGMP